MISQIKLVIYINLVIRVNSNIVINNLGNQIYKLPIFKMLQQLSFLFHDHYMECSVVWEIQPGFGRAVALGKLFIKLLHNILPLIFRTFWTEASVDVWVVDSFGAADENLG